MAEGDDRVYYVISDLHVGGDEQLGEFPSRDELLGFLEDLEDTDEDAELIVNGDAFGLWEMTTVDGPAKFDALEAEYPALFEQLRRTGENVDITLLPGNHDHELVAYDAYVERFAAYNVDVVQDESLRRRVGDRAIYVEHGHQRDPNNRIEDFGSPHASPLGYHYNTIVTSRAGRLAHRGRFDWLKDVQAVTPTERIPVWLISKYFYREMHPALRYAAVPFLLLFNVSLVLVALAGLDLLGVWSLPVDATASFLGRFGAAGAAVYWLLALNVAVSALLLLVGVPLYLLQRDVKRTIDRFGLFEPRDPDDPATPYEDAAREVVADAPDVAVCCFGHTHRPRVETVDDGLLVNTGTWLKRLHRRDGVTGLLPPVFYPTYQLAYARISAGEDGVVVEYDEISKESPVREDLTLTERLFTVTTEPATDVPPRAVVDGDGARISSG